MTEIAGNHEVPVAADQSLTELKPTPTGSAGGVQGAVLVFLASAAVLVLEIAAMRLVAPYVGVTLQTSSAVIGTALTAMALGAWLGGRAADRTAPGRLLGPLLLLGGVLTLLTVPVVRLVGGALRGGPEIPVVLALAVLAVFPPTAVLSTITPLVVKLQLADLGRTGAVVGRLSGTATLGAITATFLTGFVLLALLPTSTILLGTGAVLMAAGGRLWWQRPHRMTAIGAMAVLPVVPWLLVVAPNPCQVETDYHCVRVQEDPPGSPGRLLWLDTLAHSYVDLSDPTGLRFEYVAALSAAIDATFAAPAPIDALYLGGGGFTLPRYVAATRPGSTARVYEIDGGVVDVARRQLGAADVPGMDVRVQDARTGVAGEVAGRYDLVVGDAFGGLAVPWHLTTEQAVTELRRTLTPTGIYLVNVIDNGPDRFTRAELATLRAVFPHVAVASAAATLAGTGGGNHVLLASGTPLPIPAITSVLRDRAPTWQLLDEVATASYAGPAVALTDDHAPVDQLITH